VHSSGAPTAWLSAGLSLTLGELETFFKRGLSIFDVQAMSFGNDGYDLNRMLRFVVGVES
jgi:hypothetical protein